MEKFGLRPVLLTILIFVISLPLLLSNAPTPTRGRVEEEQIRWQPDFRLQWSQFKGKPDRMSNMDALTESGITFNWSCDWRGFSIEAYAIFVPEGSWVKAPTNALLMHEQLHFDITELHARKLRQYFKQIQDPCRLGKSGIDKAAQGFIEASYAMQNAYDSATEHGQNTRIQKEWQIKISDALTALAAFAEK